MIYCDYAGRRQGLARGVFPRKTPPTSLVNWSHASWSAGLGWSGSLKRVLRKYAAKIEATSGDNWLFKLGRNNIGVPI